MDLKSQIDKDFLEAYKSSQSEVVSVLRLVKSALKNLEIAEKRELTDQDVIRTLKKEVKQRLDSAEEYDKAGRTDLAQKERSEIQVIKKYLPKELTDVEMNRLVDEAILQSDAHELKDMGKLISLVMQKSEGAADGARLASIIRSKLQK